MKYSHIRQLYDINLSHYSSVI